MSKRRIARSVGLGAGVLAGVAVALSGPAPAAESCLSFATSPDHASSVQPANPAPSGADRAIATTGNEIDQGIGPDKPVTRDQMHRAVKLDAIQNPAQSLSTTEIKSCGGEAIGSVKSVEVGPDGKANRIQIASGGFLGIGQHVVSIGIDHFAFLKDRNLLITDLSKDEIKNMPQTTAMD